MSRKVYVNVTTRLIIVMEDDVDITDVISEMDYDFRSGTENATVLDTELRDFDITDSK